MVGAYDGHRVGVGRVAVDSTWHHFFDINLIGDPVAPFPKTEGFNASPEGKAVLADIEAYYVNIGTWIARPGAHVGLFAAAAWYSLRSQPLAMLVNPHRDYTASETLAIGSLALDRMYRFVPACTMTYLTHRIIVAGPVRKWPPDPWKIPHNGDPGPLIDPDVVTKLVLGRAIVEIARRRGEAGRMEPQEAAAAIREAALGGAHAGVLMLGRDLERHAEGLGRLARDIAESEHGGRNPG